ncbi:MAG: type VI secretion system protein TssA [Deltaproteobacteria bacterium]|nr:type VI secretion system protein TssA [Deltaproteobacteria bacterium]
MNATIAEMPDFAALGERPVPGGQPAGQDARYTQEYADVLAEIEKLNFSGQGETASWPLIEKKAAAILADFSKDIPMAAYLAVALFRNRGFAGMLAGTRLLRGLLSNFWETAWPPPKRLRGRINALAWWHERAASFLREQTTAEAHPAPELQNDLLQALDGLDKALNSLMPDAAPLQDLLTAVQRLSPPAPAASPAPEGQNPKGAAQSSETPPPPDRPVEAEEPSGDPATLRRRFAAAAQAYLAAARLEKPADESLWRLSRLISWGSIASTPQAENGQTLLPAPDMAPLALARQILAGGKALEAAFLAEDFFSTAPFCLDAQEFICKALAGLGPQFSGAAQAVREECARFAARLPGLETLRFNDGSPFAAPRTIAWLQSARGAARADEEAAGASGPLPDAPARLQEKARELLAGNELVQALDLLDAAKTDSPAENLRLRVAQLRLLCEAGKGATALALAEALLLEAGSRDLDNWDPRLALEALEAARGAFALFGDAQNQRETMRRIARLRPSAILE